MLVFAELRELLGAPELALEARPGATVGEVVAEIASRHESFSRRKFSTALNRRYAGPEAALRDGDELALIPPVSGG
ncbi:MAG: MoaD/ThiS family protein [Planctomycetes bacterium]|nr:MoaD/ThiS family protein [Planctomycetota bacterium]